MRNCNINERLDKLVKLGANPSTVDELRVGGIRGERKFNGREVIEDRGEEGLKREKGLKNVVRRGRRGDVVEEKRQVVDVSSRGEKFAT